MDNSKDLNPYQVKTGGSSEVPKWKQATIEEEALDDYEVDTAIQELSYFHHSIRAPLSDFSRLDNLINAREQQVPSMEEHTPELGIEDTNHEQPIAPIEESNEAISAPLNTIEDVNEVLSNQPLLQEKNPDVSRQDVNEPPVSITAKQQPAYSAIGKPDASPVEKELPKFVERLKLTENGLKKGFNNSTKMWSAIESKLDSKELNPTGKEIGYGVVIRPEWVGDDESKYPIVDGVPVDVNKPITDRQAVGLLENVMCEKLNELKKAYKEISELPPSSQMLWLDFAYNAGTGAIKGNGSKPNKMYQYLKEGKPIAAALETFNYWNANGVPLRGLHDRRIKAWNQMAKAEGLPLVTEYEWGSGGSTVYFNDMFSEADGVLDMVGKSSKRYLSSKITSPTKRYKGE